MITELLASLSTCTQPAVFKAPVTAISLPTTTKFTRSPSVPSASTTRVGKLSSCFCVNSTTGRADAFVNLTSDRVTLTFTTKRPSPLSPDPRFTFRNKLPPARTWPSLCGPTRKACEVSRSPILPISVPRPELFNGSERSKSRKPRSRPAGPVFCISPFCPCSASSPVAVIV